MFKITYEALEGNNPMGRWVKQVVYLDSVATHKLLHSLLFSYGTT